jgi:hypothetical protein
VYAENSAEAKAEWQGVLADNALAALDLSAFRYCGSATLYDSGNGN